MRTHTVFRRVASALSSALLLQLSLLGSGTLCNARGDHAHGAMMHAAHAMVAPASAGSHASSALAGDHKGTCDMNGSSCNMPWSAGGCASMSGCAIGTAAPGSAQFALATPRGMTFVSIATAAPAIGPTYAPELPPPRA